MISDRPFGAPLNRLGGGITVVTSRHMPEPGAERGYPDWRERLHRNLGRPSTGKWEPLTYRPPNVFLISSHSQLFVSPRAVAALMLRSEPE